VGKIPYLTFRIIQGSIYWIGLVIGFIGLIFLVRKKRETYMLLLTPVYLTLLFPIYIITHEVRYFYAAHPILLVGASIQIAFMLKNTPLWRLPVFKSLAQIS
jgi:fucose permease